MDRNSIKLTFEIRIASVALRKESVDRNKMPVPTCIYSNRSLSARRAWIEILSAVLTELLILSLSARRAWIEIVMQEIAQQRKQRSLSARRAWIEIRRFLASWSAVLVALRKESVDRNSMLVIGISAGVVALRKESVDRNTLTACGLGVLCAGRSPQGERG